MAVDRHDPRPPYVQVADDVRRQISDGRLEPGHKLPGLREMAASYGVAQMTVQSALRLLRAEGLVVTHAGRGTFVRRPHERPDEPDDPVLVEMRAELRTLRQRVEEHEQQAEGELRALTERLSALERAYGSEGGT